MAIAASGAVSFSDLRTEFSGAGAISFSDLYRGGTLVKSNAANNTATNLAASVPASGAINFTNFRSTARGWRKTFASGATDQNASTIFGSDYGVNYPKEIVINSGVTLGATSTSEEALEISTGGIGSITVTNNGTLIGAGGAAGAAGGDAFEAFVACTFVNNGTVQAGGGGGGSGGSGGNGTSTTTVYQPASGFYWVNNQYMWAQLNASYFLEWAHAQYYHSNTGSGPVSWGGWDYYRGNLNSAASDASEGRFRYEIRRQQSQSASTTGGSGGAGGGGAGYLQSVANGSLGASGGTNAGTGGDGGNGGGFGASGSNGNSGANGNSTNGASGGTGGSGGKYIRGISFVTFTNNGTVAGGTA